MLMSAYVVGVLTCFWAAYACAYALVKTSLKAMHVADLKHDQNYQVITCTCTLCRKLNAALHAHVTTKGLLLGLKLIHIHLAFVQQLPVEHSP